MTRSEASLIHHRWGENTGVMFYQCKWKWLLLVIVWGKHHVSIWGASQEGWCLSTNSPHQRFSRRCSAQSLSPLSIFPPELIKPHISRLSFLCRVIPFHNNSILKSKINTPWQWRSKELSYSVLFCVTSLAGLGLLIRTVELLVWTHAGWTVSKHTYTEYVIKYYKIHSRQRTEGAWDH